MALAFGVTWIKCFCKTSKIFCGYLPAATINSEYYVSTYAPIHLSV
jgi:hypothetical protein